MLVSEDLVISFFIGSGFGCLVTCCICKCCC